jgi:hypothetical protein
MHRTSRSSSCIALTFSIALGKRRLLMVFSDLGCLRYKMLVKRRAQLSNHVIAAQAGSVDRTHRLAATVDRRIRMEDHASRA